MKKLIFKRSIIFKSSLIMITSSVIIAAPLSVIACEIKNEITIRPINWYSPVNTINGTDDAFANDSCSILWDEEKKLFYSWMLFRNGKGFPSGWIEMTSPDLNTWTQGEYRIQLNKDFSTLNGKGNTSALGGSVWVDTQGKFFDKGDVVFVLSMQPSRILNPKKEEIGSKKSSSSSNTTDESGIAYFVSHGLGEEFYTSGVLSKECLNKDGSMNWRDTAVFETDNGLYFAISANNRLEFWRINHFGNKSTNTGEKITKVNELFVRNIGVEVPNVVRLDENLWYVSASVQDNPFGGPFQSSWWTFCEWDETKGFIPVERNENGEFEEIENIRTVEAALAIQKEQPKNKVINWEEAQEEEYRNMINPWIVNEYGTEGYAQRVVNPYQTQDTIKWKSSKKSNENKYKPESLIARSMTSNWAYKTDIWSWKGGSYGSEKITFTEDWKAVFEPNDLIGEYSNNGTAVYNLKGEDLVNGYNLIFNDQNFTFYLEDNKISWQNNIKTRLKKWTNSGGPADSNDEIIIVWNQCTLTFYNKTKAWNAHFMLPSNTKHTVNENAKSIVAGNTV